MNYVCIQADYIPIDNWIFSIPLDKRVRCKQLFFKYTEQYPLGFPAYRIIFYDGTTCVFDTGQPVLVATPAIKPYDKRWLRTYV